MNKPRLVCIGDLMLDVVVRPTADVAPGTDTPGTVRLRLGGSAGNTCRAFVRLGGKAALICAVGTDSLGKRLMAAHKASDVARSCGQGPWLDAAAARQRRSERRTYIRDRQRRGRRAQRRGHQVIVVRACRRAPSAGLFIALRTPFQCLTRGRAALTCSRRDRQRRSRLERTAPRRRCRPRPASGARCHARCPVREP